MHQLGDIVRAIALNNKLDESRDLARDRPDVARRPPARQTTSALRDLGVKQAPFVVLIGASMPSVLAEISFVTNPRDAQLLRTGTSSAEDCRVAVRGGAEVSAHAQGVRDGRLSIDCSSQFSVVSGLLVNRFPVLRTGEQLVN